MNMYKYIVSLSSRVVLLIKNYYIFGQIFKVNCHFFGQLENSGENLQSLHLIQLN